MKKIIALLSVFCFVALTSFAHEPIKADGAKEEVVTKTVTKKACSSEEVKACSGKNKAEASAKGCCSKDKAEASAKGCCSKDKASGKKCSSAEKKACASKSGERAEEAIMEKAEDAVTN